MSQTETRFLFASEAVSEGHPDKLCDQISDAVLDECMRTDKGCKVALETATKSNRIGLYGEITVSFPVNFEHVVRKTIKRVGYDDAAVAIDYRTCSVDLNILQQSTEIDSIVHKGGKASIDEQGAGDQGFMMGYATDETERLMPLTHALATDLLLRLREVFKDRTLPWLYPDAKSQAVVEYIKDSQGFIRPNKIHTLVISTQHHKDVSNEIIHRQIREHVVIPVLKTFKMEGDIDSIKLLINHKQALSNCGWTIGGPLADAGVTGRKIIVDTYGGWGGHGGGAFSGKDPSKVDRSACYACRWVAKSLVAAKLAKRVLIQVSYVIGNPDPLSILVDSFGTGKYSDDRLLEIVKENFDLRPGHIIKDLDLLRPIYEKTASYGHFGRNDPDFTWEHPKTLIL